MDILNRQFGLVIAYLLPGFVALAGVAPFSATVAQWLRGDQSASLGAPVYAVLAATAAGMVVSCFRWLIIDRIHGLTGLGSPTFNARALEERPAAFSLLIESHYRYYQFYSNTIVAIVWCYCVLRWGATTKASLGLPNDLGVLILCAVLFAGSRDALSKYRNRTTQLASTSMLALPNGEHMTNGIDHNEGHGSSEKPPGNPKVPDKPAPTPKAPQSGHEEKDSPSRRGS